MLVVRPIRGLGDQNSKFQFATTQAQHQRTQLAQLTSYYHTIKLSFELTVCLFFLSNKNQRNALFDLYPRSLRQHHIDIRLSSFEYWSQY